MSRLGGLSGKGYNSLSVWAPQVGEKVPFFNHVWTHLVAHMQLETTQNEAKWVPGLGWGGWGLKTGSGGAFGPLYGVETTHIGDLHGSNEPSESLFRLFGLRYGHSLVLDAI